VQTWMTCVIYKFPRYCTQLHMFCFTYNREERSRSILTIKETSNDSSINIRDSAQLITVDSKLLWLVYLKFGIFLLLFEGSVVEIIFLTF